ncbi:MAG: 4Fe-4S dicluster domain-containing protein [Dehalococcoidia bacterium]|nr:4Fe-4S dicluster domain-containing protein [Dehalococcoidia bacterium]
MGNRTVTIDTTGELHGHGLQFVGLDRPSKTDLQNCIHCGFCLPACPTYIATGQELESPRGRLHLISAMLDGRIDATERVLGHLDLCLQCRACETACPSGVPYGRIMEDARASILANAPAEQPRAWRFRALMLREVLARPSRLRVALAFGRFYTRSGLQALVRGPLGASLLRLLPSALARLESSAPVLDREPFRATGTVARPISGVPTTRVALLLGCLQGELYPQVHEATVRVLQHTGCEVVSPEGQGCCGALHAHAGDAETARALARRNIAAFERAGVEVIAVNAAGCGAAMKEYGRLLRYDRAWVARAERFSAGVRDVLEFVATRDFASGLGRVNRTVTLQDACHLAHAQGIREAPRAILRAIPGLRIAEMRTPDRCCGSAGLYSVVQPEMSATILGAKMADIASTGAGVVCTSNPGCTIQIEAGARRAGLDTEVCHVIEVLDKAIRAGR